MSKSTYVNITYAKSDDYKNTIQDIVDKGVCPFCKENFKWHRKPIISHSGNWFITESTWPYKNSKYHFLVICEDHKIDITDLSTEDLNNVLNLVKSTVRLHKIKGGGLTLRFGSTIFTGATVQHLHFHLIVPDVTEDKPVNPVYFPIG
jgi:diadenosine tetraphosphate (Ap4A) HIT family hydrolase